MYQMSNAQMLPAGTGTALCTWLGHAAQAWFCRFSIEGMHRSGCQQHWLD